MAMTIEEKRIAEMRKDQQRMQKREYEWAYSVFKTWKEGDVDHIFKKAPIEERLKDMFGEDEDEEREIARILDSYIAQSFESMIPSEAEQKLEEEWRKADEEAQKKADEALALCRSIDPDMGKVLPPEEDTLEMDASWHLGNSGDVAYVHMANIEELQKDGNQEMLNSDFYKHYVKTVGEVLNYYGRYLDFEDIARERSIKRWLAYNPHHCEGERFKAEEARYAHRHVRLNSFKERYSLIIAEEKNNGRI